MTSKTDLQYANEFLYLETLETRMSDSLDFHEVMVGNVISMIRTIVADHGKKINHSQLLSLVHTYAEGAFEGGIETLNSGQDFHELAVWNIHNLIKAAKKF